MNFAQKIRCGIRLLTLFCATLTVCARYERFDDWYAECKKTLVPTSHLASDEIIPTVLSGDEYGGCLDAYMDMLELAQSPYSNKLFWQGPQPTNFSAMLTGKKKYRFDLFEPYLEKRVLPANSRVAIHGDLHGGIFELLEFVKYHRSNGDIDNNFKIVNNDFYMLFLGDYVDRGLYGIEVIYTLMRLKTANPDKVMLIRGNHEDYALNQSMGFLYECEEKFGRSMGKELFTLSNFVCETLPVAIYLGAGEQGKRYYFQCCHGGMEIGYNPKNLLSDGRKHVMTKLLKIDQIAGYNALSQGVRNNVPQDYFKAIDLASLAAPSYGDIGFMWSDFELNPKVPYRYIANRGHRYGKDLTLNLLENASDAKAGYEVVGVLRAHQHGDAEMMNSIKEGGGISMLWQEKKQKSFIDRFSFFWKGKKKLWKGVVCTFSVAPDAFVAKDPSFAVDYDAFGLLSLGESFEKCSLSIFTVDPSKLYSTQVPKKPSKNNVFDNISQALYNFEYQDSIKE